MMNAPLRWLRQRRILIVLAVLSMLLVGFLSQALQQGQAAGVATRTADSFVDSIGVATHLRYGDTAYGRYDDVIKPRLRELGVRHIRDGGKDPVFYQRLNDLAGIGIHATMVMDPRDGITPQNVLDTINPILPAIDSVEGPNEWDVQRQLNYAGSSFPNGIRAYQTELYKTLKNNPATSRLAVLMPSLANPFNGPQLGYLDALDAGNMHSYPGGNLPSQDLDTKWIPLTRSVAGLNKPIVASETGWHTAIADRGAAQPGVPEQVAAKYIPRLFLEYFTRDIRRAFVYELIDQRPAPNQENNFGLLRADGSPKPSFTALKNLIALLQDPGASFQPQTLSYRLDGDLANVHHTVLQKRDGRFYLVLWQEVYSFNLGNRAEIAVAPRPITLNLDSRFQTAKVYEPLTSTNARSQVSNPAQIPLSIPDHPLIVELIPA